MPSWAFLGFLLQNIYPYLVIVKSYLSSLSSSPKKSRKTDPQTQARLPLTTMMVDELTDKNIPVPPPHSIECLTVSQAAEKGKIL